MNDITPHGSLFTYLRRKPIQVRRCLEEIRDLRDQVADGKRRLHLILSVIYSTHGYLGADGDIDTAAKFRAIERLARVDWDSEGMSRVI